VCGGFASAFFPNCSALSPPSFPRFSVFVLLSFQPPLLPWPRWSALMSHPVLEGKPNANYVRARIRTHVHSDYINEHHHTMLE
jgi:hypothetical protein